MNISRSIADVFNGIESQFPAPNEGSVIDIILDTSIVQMFPEVSEFYVGGDPEEFIDKLGQVSVDNVKKYASISLQNMEYKYCRIHEWFKEYNIALTPIVIKEILYRVENGNRILDRVGKQRASAEKYHVGASRTNGEYTGRNHGRIPQGKNPLSARQLNKMLRHGEIQEYMWRFKSIEGKHVQRLLEANKARLRFFEAARAQYAGFHSSICERLLPEYRRLHHNKWLKNGKEIGLGNDHILCADAITYAQAVQLPIRLFTADGDIPKLLKATTDFARPTNSTILCVYKFHKPTKETYNVCDLVSEDGQLHYETITEKY